MQSTRADGEFAAKPCARIDSALPEACRSLCRQAGKPPCPQHGDAARRRAPGGSHTADRQGRLSACAGINKEELLTYGFEEG